MIRQEDQKIFEDQEEIDIKEIFLNLWKGKWFILLSVLTISLLSIFYAKSLPNLYTSSLSIASVGSSSIRSPSGFSGLASMAGIDLGSSKTDESTLALEIMKSWGFVDEFIKENNLEVDLMAVEGWNKKDNRLILNPDIYSENDNVWLTKDEYGNIKSPSSWSLYRSFLSKFSQTQDKKTGIITVSITHLSPHVATAWTRLLVNSINDEMRKRKLQQAKRNIEFLEFQLKKAVTSNMKEIFYMLIEEETKNWMLAEATPEYVFTSVNKSMVPEKRSSPNRVNTVLSGFIFSLFLSSIITLAYFYFYLPYREKE